MRYAFLPLACAAALLAVPPLRAAEPDPKGVEFFESKIRPVLVEQCYKCHSTPSGQVEGRPDARHPGRHPQGRRHRPRRRAGQSREKPAPGRHPPRRRREDAAQGASCPTPSSPTSAAGSRSAPRPAQPRPPAAASNIDWTKARAVLVVPAPSASRPPPAVKDAAWPKTDIDRFILARLEAEGLQPVAAADKRTLIRRATST